MHINVVTSKPLNQLVHLIGETSLIDCIIIIIIVIANYF